MDDQRDAIQFQINGWKNLLEQLDYETHKYAGGSLSEEEYAPIEARKQLLRDKINEAEAQLAELGAEDVE